MDTFNVTFTYLGLNWFLRGRYWTEQPADASCYISREAADAALVQARRYMRNKQVNAHIVGTTPAAELISTLYKT
jgi:hypothetical protein